MSLSKTMNYYDPILESITIYNTTKPSWIHLWFFHLIPITKDTFSCKFFGARLLLGMMEQLSFLIAKHDVTHLTNSSSTQKTINVCSLRFDIFLFYSILKYTKEPPAILWILSGFETKQLLFGRNLPDVIFTLVKFLINPIWKLPLGILSMDEVDNILESDVCFFSVPKYKVACEVL